MFIENYNGEILVKVSEIEAFVLSTEQKRENLMEHNHILLANSCDCRYRLGVYETKEQAQAAMKKIIETLVENGENSEYVLSLKPKSRVLRKTIDWK